MFRFGGLHLAPNVKQKVEVADACASGLTATANRIVKRAKSDAPRGATGGWSRSFRAVPASNVGGKQIAYAVSDDPVATIIEFGSVNNPPYRTLTRAAQAEGKFTDAG